MLSTVCDGHPRGQALCYQANLLASLLRWLQLLLPGLVALEAQQAAAADGVGPSPGVDPAVSQGAALLVKWACLALGRMVEDAPEAAAVSAGGTAHRPSLWGRGDGACAHTRACVPGQLHPPPPPGLGECCAPFPAPPAETP